MSTIQKFKEYRDQAIFNSSLYRNEIIKVKKGIIRSIKYLLIFISLLLITIISLNDGSVLAVIQLASVPIFVLICPWIIILWASFANVKNKDKHKEFIYNNTSVISFTDYTMEDFTKKIFLSQEEFEPYKKMLKDIKSKIKEEKFNDVLKKTRKMTNLDINNLYFLTIFMNSIEKSLFDAEKELDANQFMKIQNELLD